MSERSVINRVFTVAEPAIDVLERVESFAETLDAGDHKTLAKVVAAGELVALTPFLVVAAGALAVDKAYDWVATSTPERLTD